MKHGEVKKGGYFLREDNRGASLIAVIVALVFVVTMGIIITGITTTNIRLREVELSEKENFYNADAVMNILKREMAEGIAVNQLQEAYREMLARYPELLLYYAQTGPRYGQAADGAGETPGFGKMLQDNFNQIYIDNLAVYFRKGSEDDDEVTDDKGDGTGTIIYRVGKYDLKQVGDLMSGMLNVSAGSADADYTEGKVVFTTDDGKVTLNVANDDAVFTMDYETGFFALKNLKIEFLDDRGFETWVSTDLVFGTPKFQFDDGTTKAFMEYALIADTSIEMTSTNHSDVNGSVYAGAGGINSESGVTADFSGDNIVTRGNIVVDGKSELTFGEDASEGTTHIWAQNVIIKGKSNTDPNPAGYVTNLKMTGEINIEDDLAINGTKSKVELNGSYNGYNFRENYITENLSEPDKSPAADSVFSSAMMVNGDDCTLDLSGLDRLYLAGRTFISRGNTFSVNDNNDVLLGESISVRADQLAYLVSERYLEKGSDGNPVLTLTPDNIAKYRVDTGVNLDDDKYKINGVTAVKVIPYKYRNNVTDTLKPSATQYYLDFPTGEMANEFFNDYWNGMRGEWLAGYESGYAEAIRLDEDIILTLSGDLLYRDGTNTEPEEGYKGFGLMYQDREKFNDSRWTTPEDIKSDIYEGIYWGRSDKLARTYKSLEDDLAGVYTRVAAGDVRFPNGADGIPDKEKNPLFNNLIDAEALKKMVHNYESSWGVTQIESDKIKISGTEWDIILCDNGNADTWYQIPADFDKGIVIAAGDIQIAGDITGMVISGGTITLSGADVKVTGDAALVKQIFDEAMGEEYGSAFAAIFKEYQLSDMAGVSSARIGDYLFYENWMKNEE